MKNPSTTRLASALMVGQKPINDEEVERTTKQKMAR